MNWKTVCIIIALFAVVVLTGCDKKEPLEVGQVWEWDWRSDPFHEYHPVRREVLALKEGYVQYERVDEDAKGYVGSMREGAFKACDPKLISTAGERLRAGELTIGGCDPDEPEPVDCADCIALKAILEDSIENTDIAIKAGKDLLLKINLLDGIIESGQDELLKANAEIVACWKIIEATKPDPNASPIWGQGNPPASWTETFGNDNIARVNFIQMQMLSNQAARIKRLEEFCRINDGKETNSPQSR